MIYIRPKGHLQVKQRKGGRVYYAYWEDGLGHKRGARLGPAHVRDTGRRTQRGAVIWRAGDGPKPTPEHLTPRDAADRLRDILQAAEESNRKDQEAASAVPLHRAAEAWLAARRNERGLKRSTVADYEDMFERLYRDLGAETPLSELADGRLGPYFADFKAERPLSERSAKEAIERGEDVAEVDVVRWTAQSPGSQAHEVSTRDEAVALASKIDGTWKHRRRGCYRVVAAGSGRPKRVSRAAAEKLQAEGWIVKKRVSKRWMLRTSAAPQTRNKYRDVLGAVFDHAVSERWLGANPLANVRRASNRQVRQRILRRDDFYDPSEVDRLLGHAPSLVEQAFWLCGAHAGFRLPGEALGMRWGAVDFQANVIRPYDNWVRNASDTTKTALSVAIPMTPRLRSALLALRERGYATADADFVFASALRDVPIADGPLRVAFARARQAAGLKPIKMYNLRHSFGTALARGGVDLRTIQALMRHERLTTTEQYLAYAPQPDLADRLNRALAVDSRVSPLGHP